MKKFTLLPVGDCFEYQGEQYSKTGPLTACNLSTNRQRMIPRSALIKPLGAAEPAVPQTEVAATLDAAATLTAFEHYHNGCREWLRLAEQELSAETATQIRQAMETARERFLAELQRL
ncbi:MAG TPA: hypothetical protein VIQ22_03680 [Gammaproteobacteria bacterium]